MTLGSHQARIGKTQTHLTPKWITDLLGPFTTDPCAVMLPRPWDCAEENLTEVEDGLACAWRGRVWMNPPFDSRNVGRWIQRLAEHGNGIALLHARCETHWFSVVWERADAILFMSDRLKFCRPDGSEQPHNSGAPPVLVAFGEENAACLRASGIAGYLVTQWERVLR
jgi:hypothetical protein